MYESVPYVDLGDQPIVYDRALGRYRQDPREGGTNLYAPGDLLKDSSGSLWQIAGDSSLVLYQQARSAPKAAAAPPVILAPAGAGPSRQLAPMSGGTDATRTTQAAAVQTGSTIGAFFRQDLRFGQGIALPYWAVGAVLGGGYLAATRKRRR